MKKYLTWSAFVLLFLLIFFLIFRSASKPLPGEAVEEIGRDHAIDIFGVNYNSNPPTSGTHFPIWAKGGVYDRIISDGYLIHSLEHGYIVISYDCTKPANAFKFPSEVLAHEDGEVTPDSTSSGTPLMHMEATVKEGESWFGPQNPPDIEVELPEEFESEACKSIASTLSKFTKQEERIIVIPRVGMDAPIALTAWGRVLKLEKIDGGQIEEFIKAFHNKGPEKTME